MSTPTETSTNDPATRRLRMGILMSSLTVALILAWLVSPPHVRIALLLVGMATCVYAIFNLLMFRVHRKQTA